MTIRDIVAVLDVIEESMPAAQVALQLATRFKAHLTGLALAVEPIIPPLLVSPIPVDIIAEAQIQADARAKAAVGRFESYAKAAGIAAATRQEAVIAGAMTEVIAEVCRLTDLVVIGQDDPGRPDPGRAQAIEAVLFGAARPLLGVPPGFSPAAQFPRIVVGWDGSQPAARALVAARPFLRLAAHVEVVAVDHPVDETGDICTEPVTYLARHDIAAQSVHIASDGDGIGMALSRHVEATGSNLLVMGGFGKSRFREFVLGGATRQMLRAMPVPVLMAH